MVEPQREGDAGAPAAAQRQSGGERWVDGRVFTDGIVNRGTQRAQAVNGAQRRHLPLADVGTPVDMSVATDVLAAVVVRVASAGSTHAEKAADTAVDQHVILLLHLCCNYYCRSSRCESPRNGVDAAVVTA